MNWCFAQFRFSPMARRPFFFALALTTLVTFFQVSHANDAITGKDQNDYNGQDMIDWIRANGGTVSPKQQIRREIPGDTSTLRGVYATEHIEPGEVLVSVPWDNIIKRRNYDNWKEWDCDTVHVLIEEMRLGDKSKFAPYVNYLLSERMGQIPVAWSIEGRRLLSQVTGTEMPPYRESIDNTSWQETCDGNDDQFEEQAFNLVVQRSEDTLMIPFFDMYNHRNGRRLNTYSEMVAGIHFNVVSSRAIEPGEQIYNTYNACNPCEREAWDWVDQDNCSTFSNYGTPEILQNFGFVEPMPQSFYLLDDLQIAFCIDETEDGSGKFEVAWLDDTQYSANFLVEEKARLDNTAKKKIRRDDYKMPDHEWEVIWQYHEALSTAFTHAMNEAQDKNSKYYAYNEDGEL